MSKLKLKAEAFCSPRAIDNYKKNKSCLTLEQLQSIASAHNIAFDKNTYTELYDKLNKFFKKRCGDRNDYCWIEDAKVKSTPEYQKIATHFRPVMPSSWLHSPREWLNTLNIQDVMDQYDKLYTKYKFLGVFPVDFEEHLSSNRCVSDEMCKFNLKDFLASNKTKFSAVFNLDKHNQSGSHWVALYVNCDPNTKTFGLCYYDSNGIKPPSYIAKFMRRIYNEAKKEPSLANHIKNFRFKHNVVQHQFKNSECGVFSMIFTILCLENENTTYHNIKNMIGKRSDDLMNNLRKVLYRPPSPHN